MSVKEKWKRVLQQIDERELVMMTREMVQTPSENPPGDEREVARYVIAKLKEIGIEPQLYEFEPKRASVIGSLKGSALGRRLMFNGHIDTVPIGEKSLWTRNPLGGEVIDGRLYGRGSCDMKGAVSAIIEAACALKRAEVPLKGEFVVSAFADEEVGGIKGARLLGERKLLKADAAVGCEPTAMVPNTCERGHVWIEVETKGKSIHTSRAMLGVNASVKMAKIILAAEKLKFNVDKHRLLGSPTIASATTIHGGVKTNVVPDSCKATFDVRTPPGLPAKDVLSTFEKMIASLREEDPELKASLRVLFQDEAVEVSEEEEIIKVAKRAWKDYYGSEPRVAGFLAGTDMKVFVRMAKIPSVIALGPGKLELAHTIDEYVDVKELVDAAKVYALIALEYLGVAE